MRIEIHPETKMFGPGNHHVARDVISEWVASRREDERFEVNPDRASVRTETGSSLSAQDAQEKIDEWIKETSAWKQPAFNIKRWPHAIEIRHRLDPGYLDEGKFIARFNEDGVSYRVSNADNVTVGRIELSEDGWIGVSESHDTHLNRYRTSPLPSVPAALHALLSEASLLNNSAES